jgi:hypothetical protein
MSARKMLCVLLYLSLAPGLLYACATPVSTAPVDADQLLVPADKVEVVYFHRPHRCEACIYVEERVGYIVNTFFQEELSNGRLTYKIFDLGDKENAAIANEYGAIGSQLFINTIKDGDSHIKHIDRIWYWDCLDDQELFDKTVTDIIKQALYGEG